ncbi:MAG: TRIC cation channel family protein [Clostridia bacterium]|nr:TRIC cation channel family protein [Clostridia bacterium]
MDRFDLFVFILELVSIGSFGVSGALIAIKKQMDPFGVMIVAATTAVGGGIIRDCVLGIHPPKSFHYPAYALLAAGFALVTFFHEYRRAKKHTGHQAFSGRIIDKVMFWLDTVGLAIYTMVGVSTGFEVGNTAKDDWFLLIFVGVITGVGGGVCRDIMTQNPPYIFVKHFYASPCIVGSIICLVLWEPVGRIPAMLIGTAVIMILRWFAAHFRWNLPHVPASLYTVPPVCEHRGEVSEERKVKREEKR